MPTNQHWHLPLHIHSFSVRWAGGIGGLAVLAWMIAVLPLQFVLLVVLGSIGTIMLIRWPWLAWIGLAVALPFASAVRVGPLRVTDLVLAGAVAIWFADGVRLRSVRLGRSAISLMVLPYIAILLMGMLHAPNLAEASAEVIKWVEVLLTIWVVSHFLTYDQKQWLVVGLLIGGGLQGLLGIYQFIFQIGPPAFVLFERFMRAAGSFNQPNPYAGYLGLTLPVAVSLSLWAWQRVTALHLTDPSRVHDLRRAVFYSLIVVLVGLGLVMSWSRGGWLGALVGVGIVIIFRSRRALVISIIGFVVILLAIGMGAFNPSLIPDPIAQRFADIPAYLGVGIENVINQPITDENFSVIERLAHWLAAWHMWESAPWLGIGPGNYATVYRDVRLPLWEDPLGHAHNIYLNILAESGLIGLAAYGLFWTLVLGWLWRQLRQQPRGSWQSALQIGVIGVIAHLSIHNFFDNLYVQGMYLQLALWLSATIITNDNQTPHSLDRSFTTGALG